MMGWKGIERVWLPEWLDDREAVLDRLTDAVRRALAGEPAPTLVPEPLPAHRPPRAPRPRRRLRPRPLQAHRPPRRTPGPSDRRATRRGQCQRPGRRVTVPPVDADACRRRRMAGQPARPTCADPRQQCHCSHPGDRVPGPADPPRQADRERIRAVPGHPGTCRGDHGTRPSRAAGQVRLRLARPGRHGDLHRFRTANQR